MGLLHRAGAELTPIRRRRDSRRQYLLVHRFRQAGIGQYHPRDGAAQDAGPRPKADRRRMPGRALPRRDPQEHPRSRCSGGHGRTGTHPGAAGFARADRRPRDSAPFKILTRRAPRQRRRTQPRIARNARAAAAILARRRRSARAAGPLCARAWDGATAALPRISMTRRRRGCWPRRVVGLHQDRGRLRPSLQLLRDPATARQVPLAAVRVGGRGGREAGGAGRPRDHADRPGHDLLRRGPRPQGWPGDAAGRAGAIEGLKWLRFLYAYPNKITGAPAGNHREARQHLQVPRRPAAARFPAVLKRMKRGAGAEIFLRTARKGSRDCARDRAAHLASSSDFPARPKRISRVLRTSSRGEIRLAGSLHLLRRRRLQGLRPR